MKLIFKTETEVLKVIEINNGSVDDAQEKELSNFFSYKLKRIEVIFHENVSVADALNSNSFNDSMIVSLTSILEPTNEAQ